MANPITHKQQLLIEEMLRYFKLWGSKEEKKINLDVKHMTKQEAFLFIRDNMESFKALFLKYHPNYSYRHSKNIKHVDDNPYAGPYDCDYVDSYDFGIAPWGDS